MEIPKGLTLALLHILLFSSACATSPRTIVDSTSRGKQVKFLYSETGSAGLKTGVLRCIIGKNGNLVKCADLVVNLNEKK